VLLQALQKELDAERAQSNQQAAAIKMRSILQLILRILGLYLSVL
jgi:hypothetical protein